MNNNDKKIELSQNDIDILKSIPKKKNEEFVKIIMNYLLEKEVLNERDIAELSNKSVCSKKFKSSFAILMEKNPNKDDSQIVMYGQKRYYSDEYWIQGKTYYVTSQWYKPGGTHQDNRTPFYEWFLNKLNVITTADTNDDWWPSKSEYDPGISKDTWLELLKNGTITDNAITMLKFMYAEGGEASCAQLSEKHGNTTAHYIMTAVHAAENVINATGCSVMSKNEENSRFWTVLFVGKEGGSSNRFIWRMRDELYEAYEKYRGDPVTVKDTISAIKEYIASEGFTYSDGLIENFWLSLKSKPFVLLAGTSGTGKTRLVKLFAKAIGAEYKLVAVRPDWSDSSDLFGHVDLNGRFVPGEITDYVKQAELNPNKPYFLCLDEMNLARVEYYLSDILSIIETRDKKNGKIVSDVLIDRKHFGNDTAAAGKYGNIILPDNLYIVGTVNMDETTFPFSKKVLDRANTIEFSYVDLNSSFAEYGSDAEPMQLGNEFLKTEYLLLKECADEKKFVEDLCAYLQKINVILQKANAHVGYRVRDEIVFYMLNNKNSELLSKEAALDNEVMQKILPRIQGSSMAIKDMLCELFKDICAGDYTGLTGTLVHEQMRQYLESKTARLPKSAEKIMFMIRRFEEDGFTSYWL